MRERDLNRTQWRIERQTSPAELDRFGRVMAEAFGGTPDVQSHWAGRAGYQNLLVAYAPDGDLVGGLALLPIGKWMMGRPVDCAGVSMVIVAPHVRGQGVAKALMRAALRDAHDAGQPLSSLYPATLPIYRAVGYGQAGVMEEARVPLMSLGPLAGMERTLPVRRYSEYDDGPAVLELFERVARDHHCWTRRDTFLWGRVNSNRAGQAERYLLGEEDGPIEGHVGVVRVMRDGGPYHDLHLTDVSLATKRAARRLWSFLASHGSVARDVVWNAGADDPLLGLLPEPTFSVRTTDVWMARVVSVEQAFAQRGWRADARGTLEFELDDAVLPENAGRWRLRVEGGRAQIERGGAGALKLGPEGLAGLYTGFRPVDALERLDLAEAASEEVHATAQALFAGPVPRTQDRY